MKLLEVTSTSFDAGNGSGGPLGIRTMKALGLVRIVHPSHGRSVTRYRQVADEKFEPAGFAAPLGHKDIRLTLAAAEALRVPMPLASLLRDRFLALLAQGGEKLDWSGIAKLAAKDAGQA